MQVSLDWMDEIVGSSVFGEDPIGAFYCPYTNTSECALLTKGWQPQELCQVIECDQLRMFQPKPRRKKRAA